MSDTLRPIQVVIGANYGDEGKGQTVYNIAQKFKAEGFDTKEIIGIKYNGGAQAGHTAKGFVHHTLSSGGTPTFLAKEFLFNPIALNNECIDYTIKRMMPPEMVFIDPMCRVTTPVDILMNQIIETVRSKNRHGSCGMGIHATIVRSKSLPLFAMDLISGSFNRELFTKAITIHFNGFCQAIRDIPEQFQDIDIELLMNDFFEETDKCLKKYASVKDQRSVFLSANRFIFEGGQGLLLDMDNKENYPHVTPSHPGSNYVIDLITNYFGTADVGNMITVNYVLRTFVTRHGAGTLPCTEDIKYILGKNGKGDSTNIPNEWQGSMRYARYPEDCGLSQINHDRQLWYDAKIIPEFKPVITWQDVRPTIATISGDVSIDEYINTFNSSFVKLS